MAIRRKAQWQHGRRAMPGRGRAAGDVQRADQVDELVAAVQQHASGSHGHDVAREHILSELVPA